MFIKTFFGKYPGGGIKPVSTSFINASTNKQGIAPGGIFLVRRSVGDWEHTGIVEHFINDKDGFETIEGNTNDDGSRDGYEVCARVRGYAGKDFIRLL